jgi:hypothetical protein
MSSSYNVFYYTVFTVNPEEPDFYQDMNLEAYLCTPQFYEQFPSRNTNGEFFLVDFYDKHQVALFEAREKDCQQVSEE